MYAESCEYELPDGRWAYITVVAALYLNRECRKRCPECHGEVIARRAIGEVPEHFEHVKPHSGCSLSDRVPYSGRKTLHPNRLS